MSDRGVRRALGGDAGAGRPARRRSRAAAHADRLRNTPAGLAAALRGLGTGALPSLWDRLAELRDAGDAGRRRARREVPRDRRARWPARIPAAGRARSCPAPGTRCIWRRRARWRRSSEPSRPTRTTPSSPSPSPAPAGTAIRPLRAGQRIRRGLRTSPASPARRPVRAEHGGGVQRRGDPQRAVERGGEVDLVADRAGARPRREQPADAAAAGDLQADGVAQPAARAPRAGRRSRRWRSAPRHRRHARAISSSPSTAPRTARSRSARARAERASASRTDQAPLASSADRHLAARGRPHRRQPAGVVADADLDLDRTGSRLARPPPASAAAPARSVAAIVALTVTGWRARGAQQPPHAAPPARRRQGPRAPGRSPRPPAGARRRSRARGEQRRALGAVGVASSARQSSSAARTSSRRPRRSRPAAPPRRSRSCPSASVSLNSSSSTRRSSAPGRRTNGARKRASIKSIRTSSSPAQQQARREQHAEGELEHARSAPAPGSATARRSRLRTVRTTGAASGSVSHGSSTQGFSGPNSHVTGAST